MIRSARILGLVCGIAAAAPAHAAVVAPLDLPDLCRDAALIVHGVVTAEESAWREGHIVTRVTIAVQKTLKGTRQRSVSISLLGGVVGGIGQIAPGEATLATGEEVVLFAEPAGAGELRVVGMAQGVFHIGKDGTAAQRRSGLTFAGRAPPAPVYPLRALLVAIRKQLAR